MISFYTVAVLHLLATAPGLATHHASACDESHVTLIYCVLNDCHAFQAGSAQDMMHTFSSSIFPGSFEQRQHHVHIVVKRDRGAPSSGALSHGLMSTSSLHQAQALGFSLGSPFEPQRSCATLIFEYNLCTFGDILKLISTSKNREFPAA